MKKLSPDGCLLLSWGYIHVDDHHLQRSSLKQLGQSKPNFMWSFLGKGGGEKVYINDPCHMTKMVATPIYGKNLQIYSSTEQDYETWHGAFCTQALQSLYK